MKKLIKRLIGPVLQMLVALPAAGECVLPTDPKPVRLSSGFNWPHTGPDNSGIFPLLMTEMFCRVGRRVEIISMPTERSIVQANAGRFFGEGPRRWALAGRYDNLVLLQPPLFDLRFMAFSLEPHPEVQSYNDLANSRVVTIRGRKSVETRLKAVLQKFMQANHEKLAFAMLQARRVDFVVIDEYSGHYYARQVGIDAVQAAELEKEPFHLLVHTSNAKKLPAMSDALKTMKADGTVNEIIEQFLAGNHAESPAKH